MRPEPFFPHQHLGGPFWWPHLLGFGLMSLFWLGLLGLLIWAVVRLARGRPMVGASRYAAVQPQPQPRAPWQQYAAPPASGPSATEILRQRYARGEIDAVTFQQMRELLQDSSPSSASPQEPGPADPAGFGGSPTVWLDPEHPEHPAQPTDGPIA